MHVLYWPIKICLLQNCKVSSSPLTVSVDLLGMHLETRWILPKYLKTHKLYSSWLFLCFHPRKLDAWWAKIKKKCFKFFIHLCTLTFICQVRKCPLSKSWANVKQSQCLPQAIGSRVLFLTLLKLEDFIHFVESKKSNFWICWCHFSTMFNQYFYYWHGLSCIKLSKNLPLNKAMMSCGV